MSHADLRRSTVGAFGMLTWDQILQVNSFPAIGSYEVVRGSIEQSGGTTGNMSVALCRLGVDVSLASRVGDDEHGSRLRSELLAEGCDVQHVLTLDDTSTDRGIIIVSGEGTDSDRTILWVQGARLKHGHYLPIDEFFAKDLVVVDVDDARLRLLLLDLPMHVSPRTRIFGTMTFLTESPPEQAFELALRHDYLSGNVRELKYLTNRDTLNAAIGCFQEEMVLSQVRHAAISDGSNGCFLVARDEVVHVPAFEIDVVDPTGAGDAFAAGVAYAVIHRWSLHETGQFANAMGALATRSLGARTSLPTLDEVNQLINTSRIASHSCQSSGPE